VTALPSPDGLARLEARLGVCFDDRSILVRALAHRSWCAENGEVESNERLEFLGDSVLGLVVTHYVFEHFPSLPEGQL
jgi:ribonuclease-3